MFHYAVTSAHLGCLVNDTMLAQTGMTPLHKACQYGHVRAVEELIKEEADVNARNDVSCSWPIISSLAAGADGLAVGLYMPALGCEGIDTNPAGEEGGCW